jgi:hypothetical protein
MRRDILGWAALLAFLFYSLNLDNLLGYVRLSPVSYQFAALAAAAATFTLLSHRSLSSRVHSLVRHPLIRWIAFLVFISLPYSVVSDPAVASEGLRYLVTTALVIATLVLCNEEMTWSTAHTVMLVTAIVIACLSVLADPLVDFRQFFPQLADDGYERTRAAGLFLQPNAASMALVFLLSMAIPRVSRLVGVLLSGLVSAAVFLTFSRAGLALLFAVLFLSAWRSYLPRTLLLSVVAVVVVWTTTPVKDVIADTFNIEEGSGYVRLIHLQDMLTESALLQDSRASTAEQAYSDFLNKPLGHGLGYSWRWAELQSDQQGTHNQTLRYMLEYGFAGIFVWPLFLIALFRSRDKNLDLIWAVGICVCGFIASLFSHNLTESGSFLAPLLASVLWPPAQRAVAARRRGTRELPSGALRA